MIEPEGTYLLWIDFSAWNMEQDDLMNAFAEAGVRPNSEQTTANAEKDLFV